MEASVKSKASEGCIYMREVALKGVISREILARNKVASYDEKYVIWRLDKKYRWGQGPALELGSSVKDKLSKVETP